MDKTIKYIRSLFYNDENSTLVQRVFWNSLYIAFFLLPIDINYPTPFFGLAIIFGAMNTIKADKAYVRENKVLLAFPLYFLILLISILYTDNLPDGFDLIVRSLSLLLFPIIFLFVKEDASSVRKLFDFLLYGLVFSFFMNLSTVLYDVFTTVQVETTSLWEQVTVSWRLFMNDQFSNVVSPSYVSLYILLVLSYYLKKELNTVWRLFCVLILFAYLFLLGNEAAYYTLFVMGILLIWKVKDKSKRYILVCLFLLGTIVFVKNPHFFHDKGRTNDTALNTQELPISENDRWLTWKAAIMAIEEAPLLGYGIGDAKDVLVAKYKELGSEYQNHAKHRYNAHNQFLQTWLETGVIGIFILLFVFTWLAFYMRRSSNEFAVFLALFIALMFESMLVRFNGIVFFSIIVPLLLKKKSILSSRIIRNV
ncbi:O-antigen polymerase [Galbibacter marinus]|uniref:O-antigen polymerase n=1 Tax=Galbibacter marinus TaxID=555500 RepID=K2PSC2_9FLAO|nr:O-antigen ligase family protein [Galbibacter marinus]EKF54424.1 O-antigen polymerase [Galbibacter marinus]